MMSTAVFGFVALTRESASMPSSSGIRTSMITKSGLDSLTLSTTSMPVDASSTLKPSSDSSCFRSERIEASSSATRRVFCATSLYGSFPEAAGKSLQRAPALPDLAKLSRTAYKLSSQAAGGASQRLKVTDFRSGDLADRGNEAGGKEGRGERDCAGDGDERGRTSYVRERTTHADYREPTQIRDRDPSAEDARTHVLRRRFLQDPDGLDEVNNVRTAHTRDENECDGERRRERDHRDHSSRAGEAHDEQTALPNAR